MFLRVLSLVPSISFLSFLFLMLPFSSFCIKPSVGSLIHSQILSAIYMPVTSKLFPLWCPIGLETQCVQKWNSAFSSRLHLFLSLPFLSQWLVPPFPSQMLGASLPYPQHQPLIHSSLPRIFLVPHLWNSCNPVKTGMVCLELSQF